jgi:uncharacterized RDD family membrane protein YckC
MGEMLPGVPAMGIQFDIGKAGDGAYGFECWKVFWRSVEPQRLAGGILYEGDTNATLYGRANVFCIAVQCRDRRTLDAVRASLEGSADYQRVAATPRFLSDAEVMREPLPVAARIDGAGNLADGYWAKAGLDAVRTEKGEPPSVPARPATPVVGVPPRGLPATAGGAPASFALRVLAFVVDSLVLALFGLGGLVIALLAAQALPSEAREATGGIVLLLVVPASFLYFAVMESSRLQATLGKRAVGIGVTDLSGQRISVGRASVRCLAKILSGIPCYAGFFLAAFTEKRQALHDILASTMVVRRDTAPTAGP